MQTREHRSCSVEVLPRDEALRKRQARKAAQFPVGIRFELLFQPWLSFRALAARGGRQCEKSLSTGVAGKTGQNLRCLGVPSLVKSFHSIVDGGLRQ